MIGVKVFTIIVCLAGFFALWDIWTNWGNEWEHWTSKEDIWHSTVINWSNYWGKTMNYYYLFLRKLTWLLPIILYWICSCNVQCCWFSIVCFLNACLQAFLLLRFCHCLGNNRVLSPKYVTLGIFFWFVNWCHSRFTR